MQVALTELEMHNCDPTLKRLKYTGQRIYYIKREIKHLCIGEDAFTSFQGQIKRNTVDRVLKDMILEKTTDTEIYHLYNMIMEVTCFSSKSCF